MQTKWMPIASFFLALTFVLPGSASAADSKPQAPSCQTEVGERGERLRLGRFMPGIKIWRLDLKKQEQNGEPLYRYSLRDKRNCWLVVEGRELTAGSLSRAFGATPLTTYYREKYGEGPVALKSLFAVWRKKSQDRCSSISEKFIQELQITKRERCVETAVIGYYSGGHLIHLFKGFVDPSSQTSIFTQYGRLWGIIEVSTSVVPASVILDVDLMATNP